VVSYGLLQPQTIFNLPPTQPPQSVQSAQTAQTAQSAQTATQAIYAALLSPPSGFTPPTPTIPVNPPASGTPYQNTNGYAIVISVPVYMSISSSEAQIYVGPTSTSLFLWSEAVAGSGNRATVAAIVPNGWWFQLNLIAGAVIDTLSGQVNVIALV